MVMLYKLLYNYDLNIGKTNQTLSMVATPLGEETQF